MAVKTFPEPPLVLIPAQQFLGFFMILLDPAATVGIFDHHRQRGVSREVAPVIPALPGLAATGPLADQPPNVGRPIPIYAPAAQSDKLAPQRARTALPPRHRLPV